MSGLVRESNLPLRFFPLLVWCLVFLIWQAVEPFDKQDRMFICYTRCLDYILVSKTTPTPFIWYNAQHLPIFLNRMYASLSPLFWTLNSRVLLNFLSHSTHPILENIYPEVSNSMYVHYKTIFWSFEVLDHNFLSLYFSYRLRMPWKWVPILFSWPLLELKRTDSRSKVSV